MMSSFDSALMRLGVNVPVGTTNVSLDVALDRCRAAEAQLDAARAAARAAARRGGKSTSALFSKSQYVLRDSAVRWCDEARREGHLAGAEWLADKLERAHRPESEKMKDPFYRLAQGMLRRGVAGREVGVGDARLSEVDQIQADIRKRAEVDLSSNAAIGAPTKHGELADAILKAGARAKSPTDADPEPPMNALSREILRQGRRRRNEEP